MDTAKIGKISCMLGAGRTKKEDIIDYNAGIVLNKKINDYVNTNDLLCTLYTDKEIDLSNEYLDSIEISDNTVDNNLILGVIK